MAKPKLPDALSRRHMIEKDLGSDASLRTAEAYLDEGRCLEAIEFLRKADAEERLAELRAEAVRGGDAFLLRAIAGATEVAADRAEWTELADSAETAGKLHYAREARRQAEAGEG